VRAGVYVRISSDPDQARAGVERQRQDCVAHCEARSWDVVDVYEDNDISAYSGKQRPAYRRLLEDLKAGSLDAVVAWHPDRLHRSPRELEEFIDVVESTGAAVSMVTAGDWDLSSPDGRFVARTLGNVARKASEDQSRRIRRKMLELAQDGKLAGGGTRPFGFEADRRTVREDEAVLVREAAERILAGESVRSITFDWDRRGVRTPTGIAWGKAPLRRMVTSPRIAGLQEHRGTVLGKAEWPGIIEPETHELLVARLADPHRTRRRMPPRRYLLTGGLLRCGRCGQKMVAKPLGDGRRKYVCERLPGRPNCGRMTSLADGLEEEVVAQVFAALDTPTLRSLSADAKGDDAQARTLARELQALEARIEALSTAHFVDGAIGAAEYGRRRAELERRVEDLHRRLADATGQRLRIRIPKGRRALEAWWADATVEQSKLLLEAIVERVDLHPAKTRGRRTFDPDRIKIVWRA